MVFEHRVGNLTYLCLMNEWIFNWIVENVTTSDSSRSLESECLKLSINTISLIAKRNANNISLVSDKNANLKLHFNSISLIYFQIIVDVIKGNFIYSYSYRAAVENGKFIFFSIAFVKLLLCVHIVCRRECTWARRWSQVQNSFVEPVVSFHHLWGALVWFRCWDKLHDQWRGQRIYFMYTSRL